MISDPILDESQFTQADVFATTGISWGKLKGILDRKQVILATDHNPGSGRRRMFTGWDVIKIATIHAVSNIGFPLNLAKGIIDEIGIRTRYLMQHDNNASSLRLAFHADDDRVALVRIVDGVADKTLPLAMMILDADRLIIETLDNLKGIIDDKQKWVSHHATVTTYFCDECPHTWSFFYNSLAPLMILRDFPFCSKCKSRSVSCNTEGIKKDDPRAIAELESNMARCRELETNGTI